MSKIKLTGSNSGYVEISSAADAGNLTLALPTSGTELLSNGNNVYTGITTFSNDVKFEGASYDVLWDKSDNQLEFGDNAKASFGGGLDMQLHSDGTNGVLRQNNNSGGLYIQADNFVQIGKVNAGTPIYGKFIKDGAVELYYNGNKKFSTTNTGAFVTGICTATTFEATTFSKTPTNTPAFHAFRDGSSSPTISDATVTKITLLTTETLDSDSAYDNSSSGTTANRFTVPAGKGGFYQVAAGLNFYADSNDMRQARVMIYKNGGVSMTAYGFVSSYTAGQRHLQCDIAGIMNLNASDYLEVYAYLDTNSGSGGYISNDANGLRGNYFSAFKLII